MAEKFVWWVGSGVRPGVPNDDQLFHDFGLLIILSSCFFPGWFLRNLNSFGPITLDNITVSFLTTLVYSSFYIPAFSRLVFKKSQFDYS